MSRIRRNISIHATIDQDMKDSGVDISKWVESKWIEESFSIEIVRSKIEEHKEEINKLTKILKRNKEFLKKYKSISDKFELKKLEQVYQLISRSNGDENKRLNIYNIFINWYKEHTGLIIGYNQVEQKLNWYIDRYRTKKGDKNK